MYIFLLGANKSHLHFITKFTFGTAEWSKDINTIPTYKAVYCKDIVWTLNIKPVNKENA